MIAGTFGWPYETTVAMTRLVFNGILEKFPQLKIVTHHCGGMVPYYGQRIRQHYGQQEMAARRADYLRGLTKTPVDYFKMFYNDTAIHGNTPALMLDYDFWGRAICCSAPTCRWATTISVCGAIVRLLTTIHAMDISDDEKERIFVGNAVELLRIPV